MTDSSSSSGATGPVFAVVAPHPLSHAVEYYGTKNTRLILTNISANVQLLETVTLQFQPDIGTAPLYVDYPCDMEVPIAKGQDVVIPVTPTPIYMEHTNQFSVMVRFRPVAETGVGAQQTETFRDCSYILVGRPVLDLGHVFISFKQQENMPYAELLARLSARAGFKPYVAVNDPRLGKNQWERIEKAIGNSRSIMVIWTRRTEWGGGVKREIELARGNNLQEILLIEDGATLPDIYKDTEIAYQRFSAADPAQAFCNAITSLRTQIL
jgi:hypothetical protein